MAKNKVSEWSSIPANNTDVGGIDINEGCAPSGINNAIRDMMSQIKDMQTGADGDNFVVGGNLTVTGTTAMTGALNANGGVVGSLVGNVTGNVTGNLTGNVTGNVTGSAGSLTSTLAIENGGTGQITASAAFNALKQDASTTATGVVELATDAEVVTGTDTTRAVTPASMKAGLNATGTAPIYACRAWVNFNGTGTVAIRGSGNVSSITDNGTGNYTVNFTTAMPDANYAAPASCPDIPNFAYIIQPNSYATGSIGVRIRRNGDHVLTDISEISIAIFR